jgi:hypothetical protein
MLLLESFGRELTPTHSTSPQQIFHSEVAQDLVNNVDRKSPKSEGTFCRHMLVLLQIRRVKYLGTFGSLRVMPEIVFSPFKGS